MSKFLDSVIGHEEIKPIIESRVIKNPSGTFLFHGPVSIGKRTTAFECCKFILCKTNIQDCCCQSCKRFNSGSHPDFFTCGRYDKIKVLDIEAILEFSSTVPFISNHKTVVIDNCHSMTWEASNRLLKILEEPPVNMSFFLVTHETQLVIPTIISRCIKYEFSRLNREDFTNIIWKKLGFELSQAQILGWIASHTSIDVFSNPGIYLKYRGIAFEFLSGARQKSLVDTLNFVEKVEKDDISVFIDSMIILLTDMLLLKNGIDDIANTDIIGELEKVVKDLKDKALIGVLSYFNQLKAVNYNLNLNLKNVLIKSHPLFQL